MKSTQVEGPNSKPLTNPETDATARLIEQAQREWKIAIDAVQDLIFIHDADMCIVRANRAYAARAGKNIIGKPYWKLFPKLDAPLPGCQRSLEEHQHGEEQLRLDESDLCLGLIDFLTGWPTPEGLTFSTYVSWASSGCKENISVPYNAVLPFLSPLGKVHTKSFQN